MKMRVDGHDLVAKSLDTARGRDLIELQRQTGYSMEKLQAAVEEADIIAVYMTAFFTLHNAGFSHRWEDLLDRPMTDFEPIPEPIDAARQSAEGEQEDEDPQSPSTDSPADDSDDAAPTRNATRSPSASSRKSPGSKTRSADA